MNSEHVESVAKLYVVATPIGNLGDMSGRAIEVLKSVDLIAAEDTRHTRPLLLHFGIHTEMVSHHAHNEARSTEGLIERLRSGESIALVSDAGTPLISDPGERLVKAAVAAGVVVVPVPGACALIAALCVAAFDTRQFAFYGFVPSAQRAKAEWIAEVAGYQGTAIFYESPHRIGDTLVQAEQILAGDRRMVVARELTKRYETLHYGTVAELVSLLKRDQLKEKGEFVLLLEGQAEYAQRTGLLSQSSNEIDAEESSWMRLLSERLPKKQVATLLARKTGRPKRLYYQWLLENLGETS